MRARSWLHVSFAAFATALLPLLGACGSGSSADTPRPRLDAVAAAREDAVLIFRDVLHKSFGDVADVALTAANQIDRPVGIAVHANRLFVSCWDSSRILFFDGFDTMASDAQPAGALTADVNRPNRLFVYEGDLYVCNEYSNSILIYRDAATIASGDSPDVELGSGVSRPKDVCVADDAIFVANYDNDTVTVYRDAMAIAGDVAPDATLDLAGSLIRQPIRVNHHRGTLYVANRENAVYIFRNASSLVDGNPPSVVLGGPSNLDGVRRPLVSDDRLYVPSRYYDEGMSIFHDPGSLTNGQAPDAELTEPWREVTAADLRRNVLFGFAGNDNDALFFAYWDARNIKTGQEPDIVLWDPRVLYDRVTEVLLLDSAP